ncbi:MAG TPA: hypothetical protein DCP91_10700 [Eggerthellaceae bacterium]|nr:hypothetical protein [Eggerthellaceae bacterium]
MLRMVRPHNRKGPVNNMMGNLVMQSTRLPESRRGCGWAWSNSVQCAKLLEPAVAAFALAIAAIVSLAVAPPLAFAEEGLVASAMGEKEVIGYAYIKDSVLVIQPDKLQESESGYQYIGEVPAESSCREDLPWNRSNYYVSRVEIGNVSPISTAYWFDRKATVAGQERQMFTNFKVDMSAMDVSRWKDATDMFYGSFAYKIVFPTASADKLSKMQNMLRETSGPFQNFDKFLVPNAVDVRNLFRGHTDFGGLLSLGNIGQSGKITFLDGMLSDCEVGTIDLTVFTVAKDADTTGLLEDCLYAETLVVGDSLASNPGQIVLPSETLVKEYVDSYGTLYSGDGLEWVRKEDGKTFPAGASLSLADSKGTYTRQTVGSGTSWVPGSESSDEGEDDVHAMVHDGHMVVFMGAPDATEIPDGARVWYRKQSGYGWLPSRLSGDRASWDNCAGEVTEASFAPSDVKPSSTEGWFRGCSNLQHVDFSNLDASEVMDIEKMFQGCSSLKAIDLSGFNAKHITTMWEAFAGCSTLEDLDLSGIGTSNGWSSGRSPFKGCDNLQKVVVSADFNPQNSVFADGMWQASDGCVYRPEALPFGQADTYTKVYDSAALYWWLDGDELVLSGSFEDVRNKQPGSYSYVATRGYGSIEEIPWHDKRSAVSKVTVKNAPSGVAVDASYWFAGFTQLEGADDVKLDGLAIRQAVDLFRNCTLLQSIDLSGVDLSEKVQWVHENGEVSSIDYSGPFDYGEQWKPNKDFSGMFDGCRRLTSVRLADEDGLAGESDWFVASSVARMFRGCTALRSIDLSGLKTVEITDFSEMFRECRALELLDLSGFNTRKARSMRRMLHGCAALRQVKLGEEFTFFGNTTMRLPGCEFPDGIWQGERQATTEAILSESSDGPGADGSAGGIASDAPSDAGLTAYASDSIPSFTPDTYTRIGDATGYSIVSLYGAGSDKYGLEVEVTQDGEALLTYDLSTYGREELVVGADVKASVRTATHSAGQVSRESLKRIVGGKSVRAVAVGAKVHSIAEEAFVDLKQLKTLVIKSRRLNKGVRVYGCMCGTPESVAVTTEGLNKKVAKQTRVVFQTWGRKIVGPRGSYGEP